MDKEQKIYHMVFDFVEQKKRIEKETFVGNCRVWSKEVILAIREFNKQYGVNILAEAREAEVEPFLFHTFVRLNIAQEEFYLFDGIGTAKFSPYFGPEEDAPDHLKKNKPDIINYYIE